MASIGGGIYTKFKIGLNEIIVSNYQPLISLIEDFAGVCVFLYVISVSVLALKGRLGEWTASTLFSALIVAMVYGLIFDGYYLDWVYYPLFESSQKAMSAIISVISGADPAAFNNDIDIAFGSIFNQINAVGNAADSWSIGTKIKVFFAVGLLSILFGLIYIVFFGIIILATFSFHIQIIFGTLILFFAAFKATRFIVVSWFRDLMTYYLYPIYASIVMSILLSFIESSLSILQNLDLDNGDVFTPQYGVCILVGAICVWCLYQVPKFAASITGGTAGGVGGALGGAIGGLASGLAIAKGADSYRNAEGQTKSRLGSGLKWAGKQTAGRAWSAAQGYVNGRKMENY
jgi:hypothetical protein